MPYASSARIAQALPFMLHRRFMLYPLMRPNNLAVVIHIDFDGDAALLGTC